MKYFIGIFVIGLLLGQPTWAGSLVYRTTTYGVTDIGPTCNWQLGNGEANNTLICAGTPILDRQIIQLGGSKGCVLKLKDSTSAENYDYVSTDGSTHTTGSVYKCSGILSKKSPNNVFTSHPLDNNYLAFSTDGILDKPVIFVEGYDPDNTKTPYYYYNKGFDSLVSDGRDLIIVNLPDGGDYINKNAELLQRIIQEINLAKTGEYPTTVIGYSMGGIIARKALKNMEIAGLNHGTSVYVSFDSPHMGANAPLDVQRTIDNLEDEVSSKCPNFVSQCDDAIDKFRDAQYFYSSPAAQEMLLSGKFFHPATAQDFPNNLIRIGVTSGSLLGVNMLQNPSTFDGEPIASFTFYMAHNNYWNWSNHYDWTSQKINSVYYDNVPGSYSQIFRDAYLKLKSNSDTFPSSLEAKVQNITFVPSVSALAMPVAPTTYIKNIFKSKSPFDFFIAVDTTANMNACDSFSFQSANGSNLIHDPEYSTFNSNQIDQLKCALNLYQKNGVPIPDRTKAPFNVAALIPILNLLLLN